MKYPNNKSYRKAKKSLGQNFLKSKAIVERIASTGKITPGEYVLEIGPGKGILTDSLLRFGAKVIAVEKDDSLIQGLKKKFEKDILENRLFLLDGDVLEYSVSKIFSYFNLQTESYKLIANIPYYITGEIIRKFLEEDNKPELMVLMLQKEVARRIVAGDKKESILSLSVKAFGTPKYIETVKRTMFSPSPNVDSAILLIEDISKKIFVENKIKEERLFEVIKKGFAHKRKKLGGNLKATVSKELLPKYKDKRAEDLQLEDWIRLAK